MKQHILNTVKYATLFIIMGSIYYVIELLWRGYSHISMFCLAGICGIIIGLLNEHFSYEMPVWKQSLIGAGVILFGEFVFGCILNLWLGLGIWDYSNMPLNILGQICLPFGLAWVLLSCVAIFLDDYLRYWLFDEEKPHYRWF